ncbi:hypothetical protein RFI_17223, partial [Reticulomyxa filosa]
SNKKQPAKEEKIVDAEMKNVQTGPNNERAAEKNNQAEDFKSEEKVRVFDENAQQWFDGIVHGLFDDNKYFVEINKQGGNNEPYFVKASAKELRKIDVTSMEVDEKEQMRVEEEEEEKKK